jgi:hypothetical protein
MSDLDDAAGAANGGLGDEREATGVSPPGFREGLTWVREGRPPTVGEAREYFDAHASGGRDPETMEECERVLDATEQPAPSVPEPGHGGLTDSHYPRPTEDQLEEEGAD